MNAINNTAMQVTVLEFCLFLSDKFMEGKKVATTDWDAIEARVERQNLTVREEKQVKEYVRAQRMAMRDAEHAEAVAAANDDRASKGTVLSFGLRLKAA
jgi:hypothetical protein